MWANVPPPKRPSPRRPSPVSLLRRPSPVSPLRGPPRKPLNCAQRAPQWAKDNVDWINAAGPAHKTGVPFPLFRSTFKSKEFELKEVDKLRFIPEDPISVNTVKFPILALPRELRDHIYSFLWPAETPEEISLTLSHLPTTPSLSRANQQLRIETLPYFIQGHIFNVRDSADLKGFREWLDELSNKWNFEAYGAIRHLRFMEWGGRGSWLQGGSEEVDFLRQCSNITTLEIICGLGCGAILPQHRRNDEVSSLRCNI
ncbi:uncharacterized protein BDZ99DRAFT_465290 [Mytilinidion resinicola]|uniref:F-box domain-containing protein n=1 Tax=Mytilinidion resinicola TaxID=574789 RepID=A0A6A6YFR1_9PEZI|nr:uncharacterized protein BDZ99DRAFT_465290 [Mytilinidion resinicola]KAF2807408.1 hypothetical protein BDZ99DRAFT_465290 [Mytilinidion resinicola]